MARATRIALDMALVSLKKIQPAVSRLWGATKAVVVKTPARPLVSNIVVSKVESALDRIAGIIVSGITTLRNKQLPREEKYLERELDKVRQRMSSSGDDRGDRGGSTSRALRPTLGTAWQYAKIEIAPPMTAGFFHGAGGKKLEKTVADKFDGLISGLQQKIKDIDDEEIRAKKEKEAAIKAAQDKAKAAAKAKAEEKEKAEEKQRKEAEKAAKAKAESKAKEEMKKADKKPEPPKAEKKPVKKDPPKKKAPPKKNDPPKPAKK